MAQTTVSPATVGVSAERLARIKPVMQDYVDQHGFLGISTLVARRGQVVHAAQVGWQDLAQQVPLAPDAIYRIYSMTKPIICTALMTLYEEGRLQLLDPVSKYLPAFGLVKVLQTTPSGFALIDLERPMLVRDLMRHTSGLVYDFMDDTPVCALYREARILADASRSLEAMVDALATLPLAYQPGSRWHYSLGIDVAARLIEVLSGQALPDFLAQRIFEPLGMVDTGFFVPSAKRPRLSAMVGNPDVVLHTVTEINEADARGDNQPRDVSATYPCDNTSTFGRGGHGLFSTAHDYFRFAQMLLNRGELDGQRILGCKTADLMHMNHLPASMLPFEANGQEYSGYGFGLGSRVLLNVAEAAIPGSVGEFGWGGAATTHYWIDPQEQMIGLLMSQYMMSITTPTPAFRVLAYQALVE